MQQTLQTFKSQQSQALHMLQALIAFIERGQSVGVQPEPGLMEKLQGVIASLAGQKLQVALIGGFSEGKTSIAAAWMEQFDPHSMKISHQESSNEVKVYHVGSDFVLIDTPGLFGFKAKENADTGQMEKYKDITKRYVSDAHLVLYVMNSTNPVKESHKDDLVWLFRTLDLLPRTVFVLSRFDEVADVEDEEEYARNLDIKRNNVKGRLTDLIGLSADEERDLAIVAVAANPFDMGVDHWLKQMDQFRQLSRIGLLQAATADKIQSNGGPARLAQAARASVIRDVLDKQLPIALANDQKIGGEVERLETVLRGHEEQRAQLDGHIIQVRASLREFVLRHFTDLILRARGASMETFADFFESDIGSNGAVLSGRLQSEFERQLQSVNDDVVQMRIGIENDVSHFNDTVRSLGKQGLDMALKGRMINSTTVLATRDGIVTVARTIGVDLGGLLKFKPWGAVNLAKGLNGLLSALNLAVEAWDTWDKYRREEKFRESIVDIVQKLEAQRDELVALISGEEAIKRFFPEYLELRGRMDELGQELKAQHARREAFQAWRKEGDVIDAEFKMLQD